ncbi:MAG: carboxypeptidase regulatory-like domain-containing protein [Filimonas sp.]|nr:carboxypeptidase regulatory-like domain-containing protein [Filimonas sp.]
MMKQKYTLIKLFTVITLIAVFLLILPSCRKSTSNDSDNAGNNPNDKEELITAAVNGYVVDEKGDLVSGATVKVNGFTVTTNTDGWFFTDKQSLSSVGASVVVEKKGYFKNVKFFMPSKNTNIVMMPLKALPALPTGTFTATNSGEVNIEGGAKINFSANSITNEATGVPYTGLVKVYAYYIDVADTSSLFRQGDRRCKDKNGSIAGLFAASELCVELYSSANEKLQLAHNTSAQVSVPINKKLTDYAPDSVPTFFLDEKASIYAEANMAYKQGEYYITKVEHFSDYLFPYSGIKIPGNTIVVPLSGVTGRLIDQFGNPIPGANLALTLKLPPTVPQYWLGANVTTRYDGTFSAMLPKEGNIYGSVTLNGRALHAGKPTNFFDGGFLISTMYKRNGPLYVGDIRVNVPMDMLPITPPRILTLMGTAVNCSGMPITKGVLYMGPKSIIGVDRMMITNGTFTIHSNNTILSDPANSSSRASFYIYDFETLTYDTVSVLITNEQTDYVLPARTCMPIEEYVRIIQDDAIVCSVYPYSPMCCGGNSEMLKIDSALAIPSPGIYNVPVKYNYTGETSRVNINFTAAGSSSYYIRGNFTDSSSLPVKVVKFSLARIPHN